MAIDWSSWNGTLAGYWFLVEEQKRRRDDQEDESEVFDDRFGDCVRHDCPEHSTGLGG